LVFYFLSFKDWLDLNSSQFRIVIAEPIVTVEHFVAAIFIGGILVT